MTATSVEKVNGTPVASHAEPRFDPVALAEAEAIRKRADAEAEALRIEAEGKAEAEKIKAAEEARKQKIANDKAEARAREEQAAREARIAESNRKRAAEERAQREEVEEAERDKQAEQKSQQQVADAEDSWRFFAVAFAVMCGVVALPVQMAAFWNDKAPWMISAPFMLEGAAWVVLRGATAAVAAHRPHWHFRLIAWLLAFVAAGVNLWHGLAAFDPATAIGTAVASIAGPGVWDLHEHGRIRKRDGKQTRRERKAAENGAKRLAAEKAADEARRKAEKEAADKAAAETAKRLAETRAKEFPKVWEHALKLAADLGETRVTEAIWKRAKLDVDGALPGESAEVFRMRNAAEARVEAARQKKPVNTVSKTMNAQRANQMPRAQRGPARKPPARRRGDTPKYVGAARKQAAITAKNAATGDAN
ncbi:hypothetical protein JBE04_17935 [Streptomyces sp. PRKS01-29]|nr:hypothetical protein [Streptomyces sabulosicollis]MBI0296292.1 hypothetical protein [Streptomyces sabulosicollis]